MRDWIATLHAFLTVSNRNILTHVAKISHDLAKGLAEAEYEKFNRQRIQRTDQAGGDSEKASQQLPPRPKRKNKSRK